MRLDAEEIDSIENVSEEDLERVFDESQTDFGKFVILAASGDAFIQSACTWEPTDEAQEFIQRTGSDPYCLEFRDPELGKLFAATGNFTLPEIRDAFVRYLRADDTWKQDKEWKELIL